MRCMAATALVSAFYGLVPLGSLCLRVWSFVSNYSRIALGFKRLFSVLVRVNQCSSKMYMLNIYQTYIIHNISYNFRYTHKIRPVSTCTSSMIAGLRLLLDFLLETYIDVIHVMVIGMAVIKTCF